MKDEREILTRDIIQKKLIQKTKYAITGAALILIPVSIVFALLYLLSCGITSPTSFPSVFLLVAFAGFAIIFGIDMVRGAIYLGKARRGEFSITQESLVKMEDHKFSFWQFLLRFDLQYPIRSLIHRPYFNHIFEFESGKKYVVNADEYKETHINTAAQISHVGETLIVVCYNDTPEHIVTLFSPKVYQYKE